MKTREELDQQTLFNRLPLYLNADQTDELEVSLDLKLVKYGLTYLKTRGGKGGKKGKSDLTLEDMLAHDYIIHKGGNRQGALLRYLDKLMIYLKEKRITISVDLYSWYCNSFSKKEAAQTQ
jgi:hypothetical protein